MNRIYFVQAQGVNLCKIGKSTHVQKRIRELNCASPVPLEYVAEIQETDIMSESAIHKVFHARRQRGEWFGFTRDEIAGITSQQSILRLNKLLAITPEQLSRVLCATGESISTEAYLSLLSVPQHEFDGMLHDSIIIGRPPKPPGQARELILQVRATLAEMNATKRAAKAVGMSVSAWCRMVLLKAAKEDA